MGTIPGEDYVKGDDCDHCFNEAAALAKGTGWLHTPEYIYATFTGVILCGAAVLDINGSWLLTQVFPCQWGFIDATHNVIFDIYTAIPPGESSLRAFTNEGIWKPVFVGNGNGCDISFSNNLIACVGTNNGKNGSGVITWGPGIAP